MGEVTFDRDGQDKEIPKKALEMIERYQFLKRVNESYLLEMQQNKAEAEEIKKTLYNKYKIQTKGDKIVG